jgi:predicted cupin superfamily sugar epimerase
MDFISRPTALGRPSPPASGRRSWPAGCWQTARSLGDWTLVSCIVAPAFEYGSFEMAPPGWQPG